MSDGEDSKGRSPTARQRVTRVALVTLGYAGLVAGSLFVLATRQSILYPLAQTVIVLVALSLVPRVVRFLRANDGGVPFRAVTLVAVALVAVLACIGSACSSGLVSSYPGDAHAP
jgi:hypothetical protein